MSSTPSGDALLEACLRGDVDKASQAVAAGACPCAPRGKTGSALMVAAREGHADVVELLTRAPRAARRRLNLRPGQPFEGGSGGGCDVDAATAAELRRFADAATLAAPVAATRGHERVLRLLLAAGADPNGPPGRGGASARGPLQLAAENGKTAALRALLAAGARVPETLAGWQLCLKVVSEALRGWQADLLALEEAQQVSPALQGLVVDAAGALRELSAARANNNNRSGGGCCSGGGHSGGGGGGGSVPEQ